ncbi:dienelactone hydrolase family protein [Pseudonocardia eucalypti]|uniref:Dienelactone hydrolase family protein n=1 Tax=Pseudonocardia eucalypti TaxID=648755 RepID=A0ABP9QUD5_9PSEU|nr:dienelactone hydrolase [Pseudonocardia eucalypti]
MSRDNRGLVTVALFHSMFGLRLVELAAAEDLRAAGHRVVSPDLFAGAVAAEHGSIPTLDDGFALMERIGWETITARARAAIHDLPADTVLGGFSMGAGVVGSLWPDRLSAAAVFLLHATAPVPEGVPAGIPVQVHVAGGDRFAPPHELAVFRASAGRAGADASVHIYPDVGHFYSDPALPDHDAIATEGTWRHVHTMLENLR